MTKSEKEIILATVKRINELSSLKNAMFTVDNEKDKYIKKSISPYMMWFEICADILEELVNADELTKYMKRYKIQELKERTWRY